MSNAPPVPHLVVIPVFPGVNALDVTGPAEIFALAGGMLPEGRAPYDVRVVGERRGDVATFSGVRLCVDGTFAGERERPDTVLVPGRMDIGPQGPVPRVDEAVVAWLREVGPAAGRVASVCAGAHVRNTLNQASNRCRKEVLTSQPGGGARDPEAMREAPVRDQSMLERGIQLRTLYHHTARFNGPSQAYVAAASALGGKYRTAHELFGRLIVFDREPAFIPVQDDSWGAVVIREPFTVRYLCEIFEQTTVFRVSGMAGSSSSTGVRRARCRAGPVRAFTTLGHLRTAREGPDASSTCLTAKRGGDKEGRSALRRCGYGRRADAGPTWGGGGGGPPPPPPRGGAAPPPPVGGGVGGPGG
ncbi:DJ-1/PfpI family protein, partial [Streptomyces sp. NPDC056831]|uniref:DJ-1/PfpI family protein n=1 Tax=Streptomyces sp. NPDC056831 TaxID=3345954 RepID=UPI0036B54833